MAGDVTSKIALCPRIGSAHARKIIEAHAVAPERLGHKRRRPLSQVERLIDDKVVNTVRRTKVEAEQVQRQHKP